MRKNKTKDMLRRGETVLGTWLDELRSPAVAQLFAAAGLDFLVIDMEHGPYNLETMADIVRTARLVDITPIVRVPDLTWERISRALDAGAQGLMLPRVEGPAEVETFVSYLKYPPAGRRGMASGLGNTDFEWVKTPDYINFINDEILVMAQIETLAAVKNVEALAGVPGVDVLFIGPEDLSIAMGLAGQPGHPRVTETVNQIVAAANRANVFTGITCGDPAGLRPLRERGLRLMTYGSDVEFLYTAAQQGVQALRGN